MGRPPIRAGSSDAPMMATERGRTSGSSEANPCGSTAGMDILPQVSCGGQPEGGGAGEQGGGSALLLLFEIVPLVPRPVLVLVLVLVVLFLVLLRVLELVLILITARIAGGHRQRRGGGAHGASPSGPARGARVLRRGVAVAACAISWRVRPRPQRKRASRGCVTPHPG